MKPTFKIIIAVICLTLNFASAQNVKLHVNPKWRECSFQLDPSLTQQQWHQFNQEAGLAVYFRPLSDARPMGAGHVEVSVLQWNTGIDETTGAWNNTFVHPNEEHWLIGGSELPFPGLMVKAGVSRKVDVGAYWSARPGSNYGFYGGQVQYNFINDSARHWALASRLGFNKLYGPEDMNFTVYGLDVLASKDFKLISDWASLSPYAGISTCLSHSHEKSEVVNLNDETVGGLQGMVGTVVQVKIVRIGVEYAVAKVNTFSYKLGVSFKI